MTINELQSWLIAIIPTVVGVISFVSATLKSIHENKKTIAQVKKEANTDELKELISQLIIDKDRQRKLYSDIEAENVALKRQYNRLLSELRGVRYEDKPKPKHKEV